MLANIVIEQNVIAKYFICHSMIGRKSGENFSTDLVSFRSMVVVIVPTKNSNDMTVDSSYIRADIPFANLVDIV